MYLFTPSVADRHISTRKAANALRSIISLSLRERVTMTLP